MCTQVLPTVKIRCHCVACLMHLAEHMQSAGLRSRMHISQAGTFLLMPEEDYDPAIVAEDIIPCRNAKPGTELYAPAVLIQ